MWAGFLNAAPSRALYLMAGENLEGQLGDGSVVKPLDSTGVLDRSKGN